MILDRTATTNGTSISFPGGTLERDIAGAVIDPASWHVLSVGGQCAGSDASACPN